ncbi:hypothetical protein [Pseudomonas yamanorum]|uniref:hypothetical protein n=1 Tax=Pseudomonas yamanorum TaxID=515393 RepID=UPI003B9E70BF
MITGLFKRFKNWVRFNKGKSEVIKYLWHSPGASFQKFNVGLIGSYSLKYGWGIYFARSLDEAILHNKALDHIYRLPVSKLAEDRFLSYTETIGDQNVAEIIAAAKKFYGEKEYGNRGFDKSGQRFYSDISERERLKRPGRGDKRAALFLARQGIECGVIREYEVEIVVLYDVKLWKHAERVDLVQGADGIVRCKYS